MTNAKQDPYNLLHGLSPVRRPANSPANQLITKSMKPIRNTLALLAITFAGLTTTQAQDPLPSWNDGAKER
jgi:hypothetical protein